MTKRINKRIDNRLAALEEEIADDRDTDPNRLDVDWRFPEGPRRRALRAALREILLHFGGTIEERARMQALLADLRERYSITDDRDADVLQASAGAPKQALAGATFRAPDVWTDGEREAFTEHIDGGDQESAKGVLICVGYRELANHGDSGDRETIPA